MLKDSEVDLESIKGEVAAKHPGCRFKIIGERTPEDDGYKYLCIVRNANPAERQQLIPKIKRNEDAAAAKQLALQATVWPPLEEVKAVLEGFPFLCEKLSETAIDLAGGDAKELGEF